MFWIQFVAENLERSKVETRKWSKVGVDSPREDWLFGSMIRREAR
jgi:hypothetical protein